MSVLVLRPGELAGVPVTALAPPPLGSVMVVHTAGSDPSVHLAAIAAVHHDAPWLPLAVVGAEEAATPLTNLLPLITGPLSPVYLDHHDRGSNLATAIREAVRRRPAPRTEEVAWYCGRRLEPSTAQLVAAALDGGSYRTLRRQLRWSGSASPTRWRGRMTVLQALGLAWQRGWSEAGAAGELGMDTATLSRRCGRCFGMGWSALIGVGTWEGVLEQGLRSDENRWAAGGDLTLSDTG